MLNLTVWMKERRSSSFSGNRNDRSFPRRDLTINVEHLKMAMFFNIVISLLGLNPRKSPEMRTNIYKDTYFYNKNSILIIKILKT